MGIISSVSKNFYSFEELQKIWRGVKEGDKKNLFLLYLMVEDRKNIGEAFNFVQEKLQEGNFDNKYILSGISRTLNHEMQSIESAIIEKHFGYLEKEFDMKMFAKRNDPGTGLHNYFFIKDINKGEPLFQFEIPYDGKNGFNFSELYQQENNLSKILKQN